MKIYVSIVSLIGEYLKPGGIKNVLKIVDQAELSGIQLAPLRGLSPRVLKRIPKEKVIAYEGSWHNTKKFFDLRSELLFGSMERVRRRVQKFHALFPEAMAIDVPEIPGSLIEISPVNGDWELAFLTASNGCVYDTKHIDQEPKVTNDKVHFIERLIGNKSIKLIHFQTRDRVDFGNFLVTKCLPQSVTTSRLDLMHMCLLSSSYHPHFYSGSQWTCLSVQEIEF